MTIFFTNPFVEREKYKDVINSIRTTIETIGAKVLSPGITREYKDAFSEENFKKFGDKNRIHYEFIRQGIANADAVIIEASEEDFRVGHEATLALIYKKPVLCLSQKQDFGKLIYHEGFEGKQYTPENLEHIVLTFLEKVSKKVLHQRSTPLSQTENRSVPTITGKTIATLGAVNIDMVTKVPFIPKADDVVISEGLKLLPGGKATNATIGMARLGQTVYLVGKIGNDAFGKTVRETFQKEQVRDEFLDNDPFIPTGTVIVTVNDIGKNTIVVNEDANIRISRKPLEDLFEKIDAGKLHVDCFYTTLEPLPEIVNFAVEGFAERHIPIFVDAAPQARPLDKRYYPLVDFLSANEFESGAMTGIPVTDIGSAQKATLALRSNGANTILITLGKLGAVILEKESNEPHYFPGKKVKTVDETAAGDAFRAAFVTEYLTSGNIEKGMEFGNRVGAYATTRLGSYEGLPTREELEFVEFV